MFISQHIPFHSISIIFPASRALAVASADRLETASSPWRPMTTRRDKIRVKMFLRNLVRPKGQTGFSLQRRLIDFAISWKKNSGSGSPWNKESNWPSPEWFDSQLIHAKLMESNSQFWSHVISWESKVAFLVLVFFKGEFSVLKKKSYPQGQQT